MKATSKRTDKTMLKKIGFSAVALFTALAFVPASAMAYGRVDVRFHNTWEARDNQARMERARIEERRERELRERRFEKQRFRDTYNRNHYYNPYAR
jgi:hypothetical protein